MPTRPTSDSRQLKIGRLLRRELDSGVLGVSVEIIMEEAGVSTRSQIKSLLDRHFNGIFSLEENIVKLNDKDGVSIKDFVETLEILEKETEDPRFGVGKRTTEGLPRASFTRRERF